MSNFFYEQFLWAVSNFFADVSSKIIVLADPILSQPDMEREMVSPPAGAYITLFTIYHVLPDLPVRSMSYCMTYINYAKFYYIHTSLPMIEKNPIEVSKFPRAHNQLIAGSIFVTREYVLWVATVALV